MFCQRTRTAQLVAVDLRIITRRGEYHSARGSPYCLYLIYGTINYSLLIAASNITYYILM
jgi:hypothetical protein